MPSQDNTPVSFLKYSASRRDDLMVLSTSLKMPRAMPLSPDGAAGGDSTSQGSELEIPPIVFADMIFDSHVSPVGVRGSASERRMRFIWREFDIYVKLMDSSKDMSLSGRTV